MLLCVLQTLVRSFPGLSDYPLPEGVKGLAGVVVDSVNKCDPDVRKDLYQHVVLTGMRGGGGHEVDRIEYGLLARTVAAGKTCLLPPWLSGHYGAHRCWCVLAIKGVCSGGCTAW
jgi:hypothetical protein